MNGHLNEKNNSGDQTAIDDLVRLRNEFWKHINLPQYSEAKRLAVEGMSLALLRDYGYIALHFQGLMEFADSDFSRAVEHLEDAKNEAEQAHRQDIAYINIAEDLVSALGRIYRCAEAYRMLASIEHTYGGLDLRPTVRFHIRAAAICCALDKFVEAESHFNQAKSISPRDPLYINNYVAMLWSRFRWADDEDPIRAELLKSMTDYQGELEELAEDRDKDASLLNNSGALLYLKGIVEDKASWFEESVETLNKALQICPGLSLAYYNKGLALYRLDRTKDAMECFAVAAQSAKAESDIPLSAISALFLEVCKAKIHGVQPGEDV